MTASDENCKLCFKLFEKKWNNFNNFSSTSKNQTTFLGNQRKWDIFYWNSWQKKKTLSMFHVSLQTKVGSFYDRAIVLLIWSKCFSVSMTVEGKKNYFWHVKTKKKVYFYLDFPISESVIKQTKRKNPVWELSLCLVYRCFISEWVRKKKKRKTGALWWDNQQNVIKSSFETKKWSREIYTFFFLALNFAASKDVELNFISFFFYVHRVFFFTLVAFFSLWCLKCDILLWEVKTGSLVKTEKYRRPIPIRLK